ARVGDPFRAPLLGQCALLRPAAAAGDDGSAEEDDDEAWAGRSLQRNGSLSHGLDLNDQPTPKTSGTLDRSHIQATLPSRLPISSTSCLARSLPPAVFAQPAANGAGRGGARDRRHPEEPELREGPASDEEGGGGAAGRVHRGVGDRDADQVDE